MKHVAFYMRVSTGKQEMEMQKHAFEQWLAAQATPPTYRTFKDFAESGSNDSRPKFREMLSRCHKGEFDHVIVYKLDRFSRSANTAIKEILKLDEANVGFYSLTQEILNLRNGFPLRRAILSIFAELAEMERDQIRERVKAGMAAAKAKGVVLGRPSSVSEDQIEEVLELYRSGEALRSIARKMPFSYGTVHRIVSASA